MVTLPKSYFEIQIVVGSQGLKRLRNVLSVGRLTTVTAYTSLEFNEDKTERTDCDDVHGLITLYIKLI